MAWTSLSDPSRKSALPLILAGPILRRVEKGSVSVFVACHEAVKVELVVVEVPDGQAKSIDMKDETANSYVLSSPTITGIVDPITQLADEEITTVALGKNLHVIVITATDTAEPLNAGTVYQYSLRFTYTPGSNVVWLEDPDTLGPNPDDPTKDGIGKISYGDYLGPTFILPADDPKDLRFAHGSCRKPHGGETDALSLLDRILDSDPSDPAIRPQQLFFTGDQIYADDVADLLLFMLDDASNYLMGWKNPGPPPNWAPEILQKFDADSGSSIIIPEEDLLPGARQKLVSESELSSTEAKSHLFRLGEFFAMYLFAWSPELWPKLEDNLPNFMDVFSSSGVLESVTVQTKWGSRQQKTVQGKNFSDESPRVVSFWEMLGDVRRALANISTYMIFDDHEVTDDWFLDGEWAEASLSNVAEGVFIRTVMQNALAAYTVFQAWGNTPDLFKSEPTPAIGREILDVLKKINLNGGNNVTNSANWSDLGNRLLPSLVTYPVDFKNPKPPLADLSVLSYPANSIRWNFDIKFEAYHLVVIDTRTRRGYALKFDPPNLINSVDLTEQLPMPAAGDEKELTILISPTPVVGNIYAEKLLEVVHFGAENWPGFIRDALIGAGAGLALPAAPFAWAAGLFARWATRHAVKKAAGKIGGALSEKAGLDIDRPKKANRFVDYEAWAFNTQGQEALFDRLSKYGRVVVLSGDVHYSFSATEQYWNQRNAGNTYSVFAQLCSSALKNYGGLSNILGKWNIAPHTMEYVGWKEPGIKFKETYYVSNPPGSATRDINVSGTPAIHQLRSAKDFIDQPDWRYRITFASHTKPNPNELPLPDRFKMSMSNYHRELLGNDHSTVVGIDNLSVVRFDWTGTEQTVIQELWWVPLNKNVNDNYGLLQTIHPLDITNPNPAVVPPGVQ